MERIRCELPNAKLAGGYRLRFVDTLSERPSSERFWAPHLSSPAKVIVVGGVHLFFFENASQEVVRYYDLNDDGDREQATMRWSQSRRVPASSELQPLTQSYLSAGEVHAFESLQRWFFAKTSQLISRYAAPEISEREILKSSSILIGRPQTNKHMKKLMGLEEFSLGYTISDTLGAIKLSVQLTLNEELLLNGASGKMDSWVQLRAGRRYSA